MGKLHLPLVILKKEVLLEPLHLLHVNITLYHGQVDDLIGDTIELSIWPLINHLFAEVLAKQLADLYELLLVYFVLLELALYVE